MSSLVPSDSTNSSEFQRLPYNVKPLNYNLEFVPNMAKYTYDGNAVIKLQVEERTDKIILNSRNIEITSATCAGSDVHLDYEPNREQIVFLLNNPLEIGEVKLCLTFRGSFADDMQGFYLSKYKSPDGTESDIICTQFESVYARRCFPCFDEPDHKATFDISITVTSDLTALSNMPEVSREPVVVNSGLPLPPEDFEYVKIAFDTTPLMSTYLVAMVVGKFDYISRKDELGVDVRVYTPPGKSELGEYALMTAVKTLPFYASLFGHKFPLPKLDLIALPDFACGAMENWGLITYRETALLIDPNQSSLLSKQAVALTVTHELAHMWFGNLVTMQWWTHLWLNEGFATWVEHLAVDYCFPDYDIWTLFVARNYLCALRLDGLKASHPIEVEVQSPSEVEDIFDEISYQKGASVIRMLNAYLANETECVHNVNNLTSNFRSGLHHYIDRHSYKNTVTEDLWRALRDLSCQPINEIMSTWTQQTGYPVLSVRMLPSADQSVLPSIGVKQRRFLLDGGTDDKLSEWYVPLTVCKADENSCCLARTLLEPSKVSKSIDPIKKEYIIPLKDQFESGVRVNPGAIGFFRVHYEKEMLPPILQAITDGCVPEADRLMLLDDQFALARAGVISLTDALEMCQAFKGEQQYSVWAVLAQGLGQVRHLLEESTYPDTIDFDLDLEEEAAELAAQDEEPKKEVNMAHLMKLVAEKRDATYFPEPSPEILGLNALCTTLALPAYERIGFNPRECDSNNDRLLRPLIISMLGRAGYQEVLTKSRNAFEAHYDTISYEPPKKVSELDSDAVIDTEEASSKVVPEKSLKRPEILIPPDLRTAVYSICMRNGGDEEFQQLLLLHDKATMQDERVRLLSCLGLVPKSVLIDRLFTMIFSDYVRKQDRFHALLGASGSPYGRRALLHLIKERIDTLPGEMATTALLSRLLKGTCSGFASAEKHDEIKTFFEDNAVPCERAVQQALESIRISTNINKRSIAEISKYLVKFAPQ